MQPEELFPTTRVPLYLELHSDGTPPGTYVADQFGNRIEGLIGVNYSLDNTQPVVSLQITGMRVYINQEFQPVERPINELKDLTSLVQEAESRRDQIAAGTIKGDPIVVDENPLYKELDMR